MRRQNTKPLLVKWPDVSTAGYISSLTFILLKRNADDHSFIFLVLYLREIKEIESEKSEKK